MRADSHFVEQITSGRPAAVGRMVEIGRIEPNAAQPRREMVDIDALAESIRERGILEPILVRPLEEEGRYQIIAGERRYQAALQVGLTIVPCVELDVDDRGCLEISLIENLQRRDLTIFEEAEAVARLMEDFGYTHEQVARRLGRSRTSITELLSLNRMPPSVQEACRRADITTKSTLMEIVRQEDEEAMLALIEEIERHGLTRDQVRRRKKGGVEGSEGEARPRPYVFRYQPPHRKVSVSLRFEEPEVEPKELLEALEEVVQDLRDRLARGEMP
jgi:ParB family chromosome partitioning protein